jgi:hypothetical protein
VHGHYGTLKEGVDVNWAPAGTNHFPGSVVLSEMTLELADALECRGASDLKSGISLIPFLRLPCCKQKKRS